MRSLTLAAAAGLAAAAAAPAQTPAPPVPSWHPAAYYRLPQPSPVPGCAEDRGPRADSCVGPGDAWGTFEYLVWFTEGQPATTLIAAVPGNLVGVGTGAVGGGLTLFPGGGDRGEDIEFDAQNGFRGRAGVGVASGLSVDVGGFLLETQVERATFSAPGTPGSTGLARPYFVPASGAQAFLYSALPGEYAGQVSAGADTSFWGVDANVRTDFFRMFADRNELFVGFRYANLAESLAVNDLSVFPDGGTNTVLDTFRARNDFYGGQVGLHSRFQSSTGVTFELINALAVGGTSQSVQAFGANTFTGLPPEQVGLLVREANSGTFERGYIAAIYELTTRLGYRFSDRVHAHIGYNLLIFNGAVRPGLALDSAVNDSNIRFVADRTPNQTSPRPALDFDRASTTVWFQGINFGVTIAF